MLYAFWPFYALTALALIKQYRFLMWCEEFKNGMLHFLAVCSSQMLIIYLVYSVVPAGEKVRRLPDMSDY